jgi:DNA-binding XRE family transcriptional regulator
MFEKAKAAGLTPQHAAAFIGVTRVTASTWFNGHAKPHVILADRVAKFTNAVERAVADGKLPAPVDLAGKAKARYILDTLRAIRD